MTYPDPPPPAVADGGPMDGAILGVAGPESFDVTMADGARWRYEATGEMRVQPDGVPARMYRCAGRQ
ncbi:hypothetical protein [Tsukamurella sp. 1534]|uniref:hypothetical protein n=1 Tax=Tsukamurella sp. 1534 TaxID=1151061 RepID=UPI0002DE7E40|nr:hypothetical protein [Tsukamurella sp. 1534]